MIQLLLSRIVICKLAVASVAYFFTTSHFKIVDIPRIPDEDVSEVIAAWNRRVCR